MYTIFQLSLSLTMKENSTFFSYHLIDFHSFNTNMSKRTKKILWNYFSEAEMHVV